MINLPDPSALPRESLSDGPVSWGEAWTRAGETTDDTMMVIENTTADYYALERAYDQRIARIRDITGEDLPNPMRVASGVDREMADILAAQLGGGGTAFIGETSPDYRRRQEEEFNARALALAEKYPEVNGVLAAGSIMEERNRVMREAEQGNLTALQSPELGMFGRLTAQLYGGLKGSARDPAQWGMALIGAGAGTAKTVAGRIGQTMMTEALINGGQELVLQGISQQRKREAGLDHGMSDMLANAGIAATFGALFGGTVQGGAELARIFKLGEGGAEKAARVLEGRPEPGDVELLAKAMNVELGPEQLDLISRSFEERVLDDVMVRPDATPGELRVFEAAQRYAEDPDNFPPPDLVERLVADEEAARMQFSPDDYERMFSGDQNAIDDIADTFFADTVDDAARRIDAVSDRVDAVAERVDDIADAVVTDRSGRTYPMKGEPLPARGLAPANIGEKNGVAYIGRPGGLHFEISMDHPPAERGAFRDTGFVTPEGEYLSRTEALAWVEQNEKAVRPSENMAGELDAMDYREQVPVARRKPSARPRPETRTVAATDPIGGQTIRPRETAEPLEDAAMVSAEVQAGDIVEPARDANGNPENYFDFIGVEDADGNVKVMSTAEALAIADEPDLLADLLESCKL